MAGRRSFPTVQANLLWAASGNRCAYLDCDAELITFDGDTRVNVGEIAHIHAQNEGGARYRADLPASYVDSFENCMIMCRRHHKYIDSNEADYSADRLRAWKAIHDERYALRATPAAARAQLGAPPPLTRPLIERSDLTDELEAILQRDGRCLLVGISGAGKSQLALSFLSDRSDRYTFRWWVRATTPELFESDLATIGAYIGVDAQEHESPRDIAVRVRSILQDLPGWLLVVDDATSTLDSSLLPAGSGHLIFTSQNSGLSGLARVIRIPPMDDSQSRRLLRDLAPAVTASDADLDQLASFCAGLPLAVAQVGSYLATTETPIDAYVELVRSRRAELMARGSGGTHATLDVTISRAIEGLSTGSRYVLNALSMMAPMSIDLRSVNFGRLPLAHLQPNPSDPLGFEDMIAELRSLSLIERAGDTVAMHELVQAVVRRHLNDEETAGAVVCAAAILLSQVPGRVSVPTEWPTMERLLPHINVTTDLLTELSIVPGVAAILLNRSGLYHNSRGAADMAEGLYLRGLALLDGPDLDPEDTALRGSLLNNIAGLQLERGEIELAEQTIHEALRCKRAGLAPSDAMIGIALAALALAVEEQGRPEDAEAYQLEALEIYREAGDEAHVADCLTDLATLAIDSGNLEAASSYIAEAISTAASRDEYWPELTGAYLAQAVLYEAKDEIIQAIKASRRGVVVARQALSQSTQLARALSTQGRLLSTVDAKAGAALVERAHSMFIDLGAVPIEVARAKGNLGAALMKLPNKAGRGIRFLSESLEILASTLPPNHRTVQRAIVMLAEGHVLAGDYQAAFELLEPLSPENVRDAELGFRIQTVLHLIYFSMIVADIVRTRDDLRPPDLQVSYRASVLGGASSMPGNQEGELLPSPPQAMLQGDLE